MTDRWDAIILGGGPGGSTLAASLARLGRRALVLERERFPRFHIGESLLPLSREVFERLGLEEKLDARFLRKYGARFLCSSTGRTRTYSFADAFDPRFEFAYQVQRDAFDELLLRHAAELGAEVRESWEAVEVVFEGSRAVGVRARPCARSGDAAPGEAAAARADAGAVVELRAPVIVDATGRDTLLASRLRRKAQLAELDKTALFAHYEGVVREEGILEGNIQLVIFEHGWFWFIPFRGGLTSVGAVVSSSWIRGRRKGESLDELFDRTVAQSGWAREFLANARRTRPVAALADFSYRIDQLAGDGWLFVGDAGGFLDPLFSTGAHLAVKGADLAATAIHRALESGDTSRAAFAGYEAEVRYAVDLFLGVVQGFYKGHFREILFEQNQRPTMRKLITSMLAGDVFHAERRPQWASFLRQQYPPELPDFA
ncbi:NAD(P)/FAD-dependent oxidoreductase [Sorangium cellulosum]|uniref:Dehydrogenase n=1 Tax=Sorangium cellulosum TaxID=56 RepID=A0A150QE75_SORCE|nr:NAD(P)/FAD-dependent oxidoreductase [Sorangium cellulosum]KYF66213.1 dehydrogenase [Sorangium cellulosum]